jgi:hypothetical protein
MGRQSVEARPGRAAPGRRARVRRGVRHRLATVQTDVLAAGSSGGSDDVVVVARLAGAPGTAWLPHADIDDGHGSMTSCLTLASESSIAAVVQHRQNRASRLRFFRIRYCVRTRRPQRWPPASGGSVLPSG